MFLWTLILGASLTVTRHKEASRLSGLYTKVPEVISKDIRLRLGSLQCDSTLSDHDSRRDTRSGPANRFLSPSLATLTWSIQSCEQKWEIEFQSFDQIYILASSW